MYKTILNYLLVFVILSSCQMTPPKQSRAIASTEVWRQLVKSLSRQGAMTEEKVEQTILQYIKRSPKGDDLDYLPSGISNKEAQLISSMDDQHIFMAKVRKWASENLDLIFPHMDKNTLSNIYKQHIVRDRGIVNVYTARVNSQIRARSNEMSPFQQAKEKDLRILAQIETIESSEIKDSLKKALREFQKRGVDSQAARTNGHQILESAVLIYQKTGKSGIGDGCEAFIKTASDEVLASKANLDLYRAELIEQMAIKRNDGRAFASVDDVPLHKRLDENDLDNATMQAFQDTMGYNPSQARKVVNNLKNPPCKVY